MFNQKEMHAHARSKKLLLFTFDQSIYIHCLLRQSQQEYKCSGINKNDNGYLPYQTSIKHGNWLRHSDEQSSAVGVRIFWSVLRRETIHHRKMGPCLIDLVYYENKK